MSMYCRQCEQTAGGTGCSVAGVCGKNEKTAGSQDALVNELKGIGFYADRARKEGVKDNDVDRFVIEGLFTTVTNVNFDQDDISALVKKAKGVKELIKNKCNPYSGKAPGEDTGFQGGPDTKSDIQSLKEILLYGLKGMAAYADHAAILGQTDETVNAFFHKGLAAIADESLSVDQLIDLIMEFGKANFRCMEILDKAHTGAFGDPVPTKVSLAVKKGPAIIVSGHDLPDLKQLLEQTQGKGVNIYTHGEMLPAHGYPGLKKYTHLAGHFGTAWQNQQKEFDGIPAAVLMTTNCIQKPRDSYTDRIFTTGLVRFPGVTHIRAAGGKKDFSPVIEKAVKLGGFKEDKPGKEILVGFGHNAVLGAAPKIIEAVKSGALKHFFLIGGCDGAKPGRNYYTEFAQKVPKNCLILTLACGKFRFNTLDFGTLGEFPRLLDIGQCNDAYSAVKIALALADAFKCTVNDLPLSLILSWYEQKAVCILLSLLSLGVKNIRIGPTLPAFITPNVLKVLVDNFGLKPVTTPEQDIKAILG